MHRPSLQTRVGDAAAKGGKRKENPIDPVNPVRQEKTIDN